MARQLKRNATTLAAFAAIALVLVPGSARGASVETRNTQLHVLMGMISGKYAGTNVGNTFRIMNSFGVELERIHSDRVSFPFHVLLAYKLADAQVQYLALGGGIRYYIGPSALGYDGVSGNTAVSSTPRYRLYVGGEVNLATGIARQISQFVTTTPSFLEVGGAAGFIYQVSRSLGFELQVGYVMGTAISTAASSSLNQRFLGGVTYHL